MIIIIINLSTMYSPQGSKVKLTNGKTLMNFASFDFLGMLFREEIKVKRDQ